MASIHEDRPVSAHLATTALTVGARAVQLDGYTGAGVGVAVIDSGVTSWHDDLSGGGAYSYGNQRVARFVDFVNGHSTPYDDNGHGTHVAGIIAGNGYDSLGWRAGIAPGAHLVVLKALDGNNGGRISNIIAALDYAVAHKAELNIRVINLSVGAYIRGSYNRDPLTLAAKTAVQAGIVVVAAAGNLGRAPEGGAMYGSITAPGNAPWVLTVGASNAMGTAKRGDDTIAAFSSRGPTAVDFAAKPDIVAPGANITSLSDATSLLYTAKPDALVNGILPTSYKPYLALSGTSMAAPVVAGSVALMLQANPNLTPNAVKAILQYTAQVDSDYDYLTQGAGFLNTRGAVRLAKFYKRARAGDRYPSSSEWSHHILWGNYRLSGGFMLPVGNAWATNVVWGSWDNIVWGSVCPTASCDNIVWGSGDNIVWGSGDNIVWGSGDNIVWGSGDNIVWGSGDNIVWGSGDNIVWGSVSFDNIVWGSDCGWNDCDNVVCGSGIDDNIVWGSNDNIVWGSGDNIVWGSGDNIVWGSGDNIVWGSGDNIVWGSAEGIDNIVWGSSLGGDNIVWGSSDNVVWGSNSAGETTAPVGDTQPTDAEIAEALALDSDTAAEATPPPDPPLSEQQPSQLVSDSTVTVGGGTF